MAKSEYDLSKNLYLNRWMLKQFGYSSWDDISAIFNKPELEGLKTDGTTRYYSQLRYHLLSHQERNPDSVVTEERLKFYDANIVRHWKSISEKRNRKGVFVYPKYFQYFGLLFTELYLDLYFQSKESFLEILNKGVSGSLGFEARFQLKDLNMLAFWCATGSGKTLIMHVNIQQYWYYHDLYTTESEKIHKTLLLTPNEGLSSQHSLEMTESGINNRTFSKQSDTLDFRDGEVEILEITKLVDDLPSGGGKAKDEQQRKSVVVEFFEGHNLVLVDEGHKGSGGDAWIRRRRELSSGGFCFEYSATFGQALKDSASELPLYENSIILDYSYKHFYKDGYGKEFSILNIENKIKEDLYTRYLTANITAFFQQLNLFRKKKETFREYLIEKPLCLFIGTTVISKGKSNAEIKDTLSDVQEIVLFLSVLCSSGARSEIISILNLLLRGKLDLKDQKGGDVFDGSFAWLMKEYGSLGAEVLYQDLLKDLFNADAPGLLHFENLKSTDGEISLKVGSNAPFAVINIGDPSGLLFGLEKYKEGSTVNYQIHDNQEFSGSCFKEVNRFDSTINMLIGAKKFIEGWSSWRVSAIGLLNIGKKEGSQIIQLFGRGVRLKGKEMSLKRSYSHAGTPDYLETLETLNVFGVRANYIALFKDLIEKELDEEVGYAPPVTLKVKNSLSEAQMNRLYTIIIPRDKLFNKSEVISLEYADRVNGIHLRWFDPVQAVASRKKSVNSESAVESKSKFKALHLRALNWYKIYDEIQEYKNEKRYFNLNISMAILNEILKQNNWYDLIDCESLLIFDDFKNVKRWEQMAVALLKNYIDKYYSMQKEAFESLYRVYASLSSDDKNLIKEYVIKVEEEQEELKNAVYNLKNSWDDASLKETEWCYQSSQGGVNLLHLYNPVVYLGTGKAVIKPVVLDQPEEYQFIRDLEKYVLSEPECLQGKEVFLMRNSTRGRGVGFFEANNFYPDFMLWIIDGDQQYLTFLDPKGLRNIDSHSSPKLEFYKTIKEIQESIKIDEGKRVLLDSYIISTTAYGQLTFQFEDQRLSKEEYEERHVVFQKDDVEYVEKIFAGVLG